MKKQKLNKPRVFCIGWHKTGTTTLGEALLILNYKVVGARLDLAEPLMKGNIDYVLQIAKEFEAFQDVPWAALYKELDEAFPGSKFILTIRPAEAWLNSAKKHFGDRHINLHQWLYGEGNLTGNESLYLKRYQEHNEAVQDYFKGRPNDLLVMSLADGDGWQRLCSFLELDTPRKPFPHANKGKHSYNWKDKIKDVLRKTIPLPIRRSRIAILENMGLHWGENRFNNHYENRVARRKDNHKN